MKIRIDAGSRQRLDLLWTDLLKDGVEIESAWTFNSTNWFVIITIPEESITFLKLKYDITVEYLE